MWKLLQKITLLLLYFLNYCKWLLMSVTKLH